MRNREHREESLGEIQGVVHNVFGKRTRVVVVRDLSMTSELKKVLPRHFSEGLRDRLLRVVVKGGSVGEWSQPFGRSRCDCNVRPVHSGSAPHLEQRVGGAAGLIPKFPS